MNSGYDGHVCIWTVVMLTQVYKFVKTLCGKKKQLKWMCLVLHVNFLDKVDLKIQMPRKNLKLKNGSSSYRYQNEYLVLRRSKILIGDTCIYILNLSKMFRQRINMLKKKSQYNKHLTEISCGRTCIISCLVVTVLSSYYKIYFHPTKVSLLSYSFSTRNLNHT